MVAWKLVPLILGLLLHFAELGAQVVLYNGGTVIQVEESAILYVQGSYEAGNGTDSPGMIGLSGEMVIEGDWVNNSSGSGFMVSDTGTLKLVGLNNPQTILGNSPTRFPNLHLARPGLGKQVLLQIDCEAFGFLNLEDDVLNTRDFSFFLSNSNPNSLLRNEGNTTPFLTNADGGYIISSLGSFSRRLSPDFKFDEYLFPMGNSARWQPVTIAADLDSSNVYTVRFVDEPPPALFALDSNLSSINPDWYHLIHRSGNDAKERIRIFYDPVTSDICNPAEVSLAQYQDQQWSDLPNTYSYSGGNYLSSTEVKNYPESAISPFSSSYFALAGRIQADGSPSCAFPPELLQLTVSTEESGFLLQWEVEPKPNLTGYLIGRSESGFNFIDVGWHSASTATVPSVAYSYLDSNVVQNQRYFYRVEELDINGGNKLSNVVEVILLGDQSVLIGELFPNPSTGQTSIWLSTTEEMPLEINIYNSIGQRVFRENLNAEEGYQVFQIRPDHLSSGSYIVLVKFPGGQTVRRWMVD